MVHIERSHWQKKVKKIDENEMLHAGFELPTCKERPKASIEAQFHLGLTRNPI
jgi:hypothetical protein